jgi:hypothetical protein
MFLTIPELYEMLNSFLQLKFLLALFRVQDVLDQESPGEAAAAAESIKADLSIVYRSMIGRIDARGLKLLQWVLFATGALTLDELRFAIAIRFGMTDLNPSHNLPYPSFVNWALGLLTVESESRTVRFVHLTIKEYLYELIAILPRWASAPCKNLLNIPQLHCHVQ